ncbi:helix-turn-helix transcriptional regulator [Flammeovirga agarivorans]|uniref:Helix-turn-helix transcriptional regulator n=1 Tax=Flammeovirga agarivorans TaxID=2726742 RepID=A0A7X8SJM0_9BACT|nr:AraC family transcriptional regulator [Flammeovirga agarivorans]NLR91464.1 helix-turn-helix transcriptional regulator [Flammeovirga agarivorans]
MINHIQVEKDFGWFIGSFDNNQFHKHYALQISIPLTGTITINTPIHHLTTQKAIIIKSNIKHQVLSKSDHFILLINPVSALGHFWNRFLKKDIQEINTTIIDQLISILHHKTSFPDFIEQVNSTIQAMECNCKTALHDGDLRISNALDYLYEHADRIVSLEEIANYSHLSESRFIHLFKENTGITYRRAQLWNKILVGMPLIGTKTFTEIAHQTGFSDSAHFSRVFKENFGFSPRDFLHFSQFIQV